MKIKRLFLIGICILAILSISAASAGDNFNETDSAPNIDVPTKIWKDGDYNITIESQETATVDITGAITCSTTVTSGKSSIPIKNLTTGVHNIGISYLGNLTSFQKEYNITVLKENPDWDLDFTGLDGEMTLGSYNDHELSYLYGDIINSPEGLTGNFSFYVDGELYEEFNVQEHGKFIYYETLLRFKDYNFTLTYSGDDYFKPATKSKILSVKEVVIDIPSTVILGYKDEILVDIYYMTGGTLSIYINGKLYKTEEFTEESYSNIHLKYSLSHLKLDKTYDIEVKFNNDYMNITKKATVNVNNRDYVSFDEKHDYIYGEDKYYRISAPEINLDIRIDGEKVDSKYKKGQHRINISSLKPGSHILTVNYKGDKTFAENTFSTALEIIVRPDYSRDVKQNEENNFSLTLGDNFRGNLTIEVTGKDNERYLYETVEIINSKANIRLPTYHVGKYMVKAYFTGNHEINEMACSYTVRDRALWEIEPGWFSEESDKIFIEDLELNEECSLNLTMPGDAVGTLTVQLKKDNGEYEIYETVELKNGKANIMLPTEHVGKYRFKISFDGNYELTVRQSDYLVKSDYYITTVLYPEYGSKENITLKLPENGTGTLTLEIKYDENDTYTVYKTVKLENGRASIEFPTNRVGNIYYNALYEGNYEVLNRTDITTTINPIFDFKRNTFSVLLDNETVGTLYVYDLLTGEKICATDIISGKAEINMTDYLKEIDSEIEAYVKIESSRGTFELIKTLNPIFDIKIIADDVSMYYADGHTFKATIYRNNRTVPSGEEITIKIGSKTYRKTTDSNGTVKIKLTQIPNSYTIITKYKTKKVENTLNVKQVLVLKKVNVKKSAKKLVLTATLKKGKSAMKNQKVTFKFNGKTYNAKTNKKGIAKVTVKKSILKKLKTGKKLTYSATYLKNTVKKTVKVKN